MKTDKKVYAPSNRDALQRYPPVPSLARQRESLAARSQSRQAAASSYTRFLRSVRVPAPWPRHSATRRATLRPKKTRSGRFARRAGGERSARTYTLCTTQGAQRSAWGTHVTACSPGEPPFNSRMESSCRARGLGALGRGGRRAGPIPRDSVQSPELDRPDSGHPGRDLPCRAKALSGALARGRRRRTGAGGAEADARLAGRSTCRVQRAITNTGTQKGSAIRCEEPAGS